MIQTSGVGRFDSWHLLGRLMQHFLPHLTRHLGADLLQAVQGRAGRTRCLRRVLVEKAEHDYSQQCLHIALLLVFGFGWALCRLDFHCWNLQQRYGFSRSFSFNGNGANTAINANLVRKWACVLVFFWNVMTRHGLWEWCSCLQFLMFLLELFKFCENSVTFVRELVAASFQIGNLFFLGVNCVLHFFHLFLFSVARGLGGDTVLELLPLYLFLPCQMIQLAFTSGHWLDVTVWTFTTRWIIPHDFGYQKFRRHFLEFSLFLTWWLGKGENVLLVNFLTLIDSLHLSFTIFKSHLLLACTTNL